MIALIVVASILLSVFLVLRFAAPQTYLFKCLLFVDLFAAALIFRDADVTISSMTGLELKKAKPALWARVLGGVLNKIQPGHCTMAITDDIARAEAAVKLLKS